MSSLLPANATEQERALEGATARIGDVPVPLRDLWNADTCPEHLLPWLAWAFSVDEWGSNWPEANKRDTIRQAVEVQRRKGTVWSIRRALANAGYGTVSFLEGLYARPYNGSALHNGFITYGDVTEWAKYRVVLDRPIANRQAAQVRRILEATAPARCELVEFVYTEANNVYDGAIYYDGEFNHGTAA